MSPHTSNTYLRGLDYPNEGFIQTILEKHFAELGYERIPSKYSDYVGIHPVSGQQWVIEAKGESKAIGLDFRTCLGQLIQRMENKNFLYGIAMPDITQYHRQTALLQPWVRQSLRIHWIFVNEVGIVRIVSPENTDIV